MPGHDQYGLPVAYYRGGTSKALFFREENLPKPGPQRDKILKRVMGSPDPLQIDGMGGSKAVTSKIAIIKRSARDDADVDYTFAQVGTADNVISYDANCGNISAAVGPFAIDEGLTTYRPGSSGDPQLKAQEVRIYNTGTRKLIISHVPIDDNGYAVSKGNQEISGVPGAGAPILMDYKHTLGATLSKGIFPSGRLVDIVNIAGKDVQVTICDVANWCVFVNASDFGITGHESAAELTANASWIENSQELRGKVGQLLGLTSDWR
ncbi:PrpF protein, partial [Talaromyces proteolyticus]